MKRTILSALVAVLICGPLEGAKKKDQEKQAGTPLDRYVAESMARAGDAAAATPGSIWRAGSPLADAARDVRASQIDDVLTIVVAENASAVTTGTTKTSRQSSTNNSIGALAGFTGTAGRLANLANVSGNTQLNGQGTTSRVTTLSTTVTARVTHVLPNGNLVVEASKDTQVNSEHQVITVRGVVRPDDIDSTNSVPSDRLGQLEVHVNGKGVVGDAIKRPFFLYRLLLGLLPF